MKIGEKCPITGLRIEKVYENRIDKAYSVSIDGNDYSCEICEGCASKFFDRSATAEFSVFFRKDKGTLLGHLLRTNFKELRGKKLHFNSNPKFELNDPKNVDLKDLTQKLVSENTYPIHRKEKADNILRSFYQLQKFEGDKIQIGRTITFWGNLFLQSFEELAFYLREFENKGWVTILRDNKGNFDKLQFTFEGLDKIEELNLNSADLTEKDTTREYQIGLSFAGEQRDYVEQVAEHLKKLGIKTFYDNYESVDLWGKNLYQHLNDIYKNKCLYCIIFISKQYANKLWTKHELRGAQARAFRENHDYILPARFDDTELPGLDETMGYIDLTQVTPSELAKMAHAKIQN
ncbi:MAG: toll/interleukin-1 receptor domain-containing protein [Flavobacteriaceae bacterium]